MTTLAKPSQQAVQNKASCTSRSRRTLRQASRMNDFMAASVGSACDDDVTALDKHADA